jgi:aldehyde dehydrogenase (NAD+)
MNTSLTQESDMREALQFYVDGRWVSPTGATVIDVIDPADAGIAGRVAIGNAEDVDHAVAAARKAFDSFSRSSVQERLDLLDAIIAAYQKRADDIAAAVTAEMGAPAWLASAAQVPIGLAHLQTARQILEGYEFSEKRGATLLAKEPVGSAPSSRHGTGRSTRSPARSPRRWRWDAPWCSNPRRSRLSAAISLPK